MAQPSSVLSEDRPVIDPRQDRLGYAPFAEQLAESIAEMTASQGLVLAVYGPWGSGKTTVLNFVTYYLEHSTKADQWLVVHFNPWWFSGHEDLTRTFFDQLQGVLNARKIGGQKLRRRISAFAEIVSETPIPYASSAKALSKIIAVRQQSIPELKAEISEILGKQNKHFLIIIDDIDRLTAEEIRTLFRVIKAIADFPHVVYLLAFDKEVAISAVAQLQGIDGEAYLEKIVQVPFELPPPDKISLRRLLGETLDAILADVPEGLFDQGRWQRVFFDGIDQYINTPRDGVRLINTLSVTYGRAIKDEINPVDFIAIESLRVFEPTLYDIIRRNGDAFTGSPPSVFLRETRPEELRPMYNGWLEKVRPENREATKQLLMQLFPKLGAVWANNYVGPDEASTWRRHLRIAAPDKFPIYFRLAVPEGVISHTEMKGILALTNDASVFGAKLLELKDQRRPDGSSRLLAILDELQDYTGKDIPESSIFPIIKALFTVGDRLQVVPEPVGSLDFGSELRIARITWQLLQRIDEARRFDVLRRAIQEGRALSTICREIATLDQEQGRHGQDGSVPENEWEVNAVHLNDLEAICVEKIRQAAADTTLLDASSILNVLHRWKEWAGLEEPSAWVRDQVKTDRGLIDLLAKLMSSTTVHSGDGSKRFERLDPEWLKAFLDPAEIIGRIRKLAGDTSLIETETRSVRQFVREYGIREQGKDPSRSFDWDNE